MDAVCKVFISSCFNIKLYSFIIKSIFHTLMLLNNIFIFFVYIYFNLKIKMWKLSFKFSSLLHEKIYPFPCKLIQVLMKYFFWCINIALFFSNLKRVVLCIFILLSWITVLYEWFIFLHVIWKILSAAQKQ